MSVSEMLFILGECFQISNAKHSVQVEYQILDCSNEYSLMPKKKIRAHGYEPLAMCGGIGCICQAYLGERYREVFLRMLGLK